MHQAHKQHARAHVLQIEHVSQASSVRATPGGRQSAAATHGAQVPTHHYTVTVTVISTATATDTVTVTV